MIYELKRNEFYRCNCLINQQGQLEVKAVIKGINPGRIFVDNVNSPHSGMAWLGNNDGFFFIGNEENEMFTNQINNFIDTVIKPDAEKVGLNTFEAIGAHPKWNKVIERMFKHRKLSSWKQKVYILHKAFYQAKNESILEDGFSIKKISRRV